MSYRCLDSDPVSLLENDYIQTLNNQNASQAIPFENLKDRF